MNGAYCLYSQPQRQQRRTVINCVIDCGTVTHSRVYHTLFATFFNATQAKNETGTAQHVLFISICHFFINRSKECILHCLYFSPLLLGR